MKCADDSCMYNLDDACNCKKEVSLDYDHACEQYEELEEDDE